MITTTSKSPTVTPKPYNFQSTKGFTDVEWKALHEIEEKHAEEFKNLMNRALNPLLYSDEVFFFRIPDRYCISPQGYPQTSSSLPSVEKLVPK